MSVIFGQIADNIHLQECTADVLLEKLIDGVKKGKIEPTDAIRLFRKTEPKNVFRRDVCMGKHLWDWEQKLQTLQDVCYPPSLKKLAALEVFEPSQETIERRLEATTRFLKEEFTYAIERLKRTRANYIMFNLDCRSLKPWIDYDKIFKELEEELQIDIVGKVTPMTVSEEEFIYARPTFQQFQCSLKYKTS